MVQAVQLATLALEVVDDQGVLHGIHRFYL